MMSKECVDPGDQYELVQARMALTMHRVRQWFLVALCSWGVVVVTTLIVAIAIVFGMAWLGYDADGAEAFTNITMKAVNVVLVVVYASATIAVAYFLRYMYLDSLLKKQVRTTE
jgi:hypothetical protein